MLKYSLVLLATAAIISGCDGECCSSGEPEVEAEVNPIAPVANISGFADNFQCTAGSTFNVTNSSTDADNNIDASKTTWTPASVGTAGTINCPVAGAEQEICLSVTDLDGKTDTDCKTLKGPDVVVVVPPTLKDPIIDLNITSIDAGNTGFSIGCLTIKDQDTIDNDDKLYGTGKAIEEIYWHVDYPDGTTSDYTQTEWNSPAHANNPAGFCGKWIGGNGTGDAGVGDAGKVTITSTPVDNEDDNKTYTFIVDPIAGTITKQP